MPTSVERQLDSARRRARRHGRSTVHLADGVYRVKHTLVLPIGVSLVMQPGATLRAADGFAGEAILETEPYPHTPGTPKSGWEVRRITGGMIDGGGQPLTGIRTINDREIDITDLTVRNCTRKGLHIGTDGDCEVNLRSIRVQCERGIIAEADSVGIHYHKATDSLVSQAVIIGYGVGLRSDSSSNDFHQVHVWNYDLNQKLRTCFECSGWNDSYSQCYADSPMNGDDIGIGFHVRRPFQRFSDCRVFLNQWVTPRKVVGFRIEPHGTHGTYLGCHFAASTERPFLRPFEGPMQAATVLGCTYTRGAENGAVTQIPSRGGGTTQMPPLHIVDAQDAGHEWRPPRAVGRSRSRA